MLALPTSLRAVVAVFVALVAVPAGATAAPLDAERFRPATLAARDAPAPPIGRTVRGALTRARLAGTIDLATHDRWRRAYWAAGAALRELPRGRRAELLAVIRTVEALAASGRLTASRMPLAFLELERNTTWWKRPARALAPGGRVTLDDLTWQYFPGRGLHVHPLATAGHLNALARRCEDALDRCPRRELRRRLDRFVSVSSRRGDFRAWEYLVSYGTGRAPWISGMAQGTAAQALARGAELLEEPAYRKTALEALGAFEAAPPVGVAVPAPGGRHYLMYSFQPGLRILNGHLQAVIGLHDVAEKTGSRRARRLYRRGEHAGRPAIRAADTGAWSLYSAGGRESDLGYHRLVGGFLSGLCDRTDRGAYCAPARRFARYETEPPRIDLGVPRRPRAAAFTSLRFRLSKVSDVEVAVWNRERVVMRRELRLPRGSHVVPWTPPARGAYSVKVSARGLAGPAGSARRTVRVRRSLADARKAAARRKAARLRRAARKRAARKRAAGKRAAPRRQRR